LSILKNDDSIDSCIRFNEYLMLINIACMVADLKRNVSFSKRIADGECRGHSLVA